jgi:dolichol-phosphate mannosyltransferase
LPANALRCYREAVNAPLSLAASSPSQFTTPARARPGLSVVVPVRNEADNIAPLVAELGAALAGIDHEIIYVDDGSTDETPQRLQSAAAAAGIRWKRHRGSCGQSAAVITGVGAASGIWIATIDGDGQNDPADIPRLYERAVAIEAEAAASHPASRSPQPVLIAGHRTRRRDGVVKRLSSKIANSVRSRLLGDRTPDTGCGLKLFRREAFLALPHFDHMHRFLPALFIRAGGTVESVPVGHRPRVRGTSKYGTLDRLAVGIVDLAGVAWLQRRGRRPEVTASSPGEPERPV